ncbi:dephospho-CoA kinase [Parasphingopyxis algicola]|uniref:dephospho-CoA kinase n=1 Tax=Parasphingopyxis algicola TaxID=2026624 RepID=UPI00159F7CCE|nr:dephospho-CoA kinase [Parasphingopyxis algicola]QLC25635.1 dephospho-CoA kinase [Parasphingopyxis algicola]
MILLGLTGSIGMGKSTVAAMFAAAGVPVFDADAEVHRLQGPGGELVAAIEELFPGTTGPDGVDRAKLSKAVLGDSEKLRALEELIHPAVGLNRAAFLEEHRDAPLVLFDIPLLYEKTGDAGLDAVIVVSAPAEIQRERVLKRPGMTVEKFEHILGLQLPDAEKRARADFIIDTGTTLEKTRAQVDALVTCLRAHDVRYCKQCVK